MRRSERIRKSQDANEAEESHPKKINSFTAKILLAFYTYLSTVCTQYKSRVINPKPGATTYDKFINRFHEANEMYDITLKQLNLSVFTTSSNDNYTYLQSMQQNDKYKFTGAAVVEVMAHKECDHWTMVPLSSLSVGTKTSIHLVVQEKRFPDGSLNKHKDRICANGGIQRWGDNYWET